jgi:hypothetical protein
VFLRQYGRPEEAPEGHDAKSIVESLRKFIASHWQVCALDGDVKIEQIMKQPMHLKQSVCLAILNAAPLSLKPVLDAEEKVEESSVNEVCLTTKALQVFLNNLRHPQDLPSAMEQLSKNSQ